MTSPAFPSWRFRKMVRGELNVDPVEEEFFTTETLGSVAGALVREAIQNSLDAAAGGEPVRVRFALARAPAKEDAARRRYLESLRPHLEAAGTPLEPPSPDEPADCLLVEDFGTRGLEGDPRQLEDPVEELEAPPAEGPPRRNDFYFFWRNIGRSRKAKGELGRWGLGKTVFQAVSRIHAFWGLTVRRSDRRALLMGQAVLKIHRLGGERYAPYGYFGIHDPAEAASYPVEDPEEIGRFRAVFDLERKDEPGLSLAVPYPDPELDAVALIDAVIEHYFLPILEGRLAVDVEAPGRKERIDASTIERVARGKGQRRNLRGLVRLALWGRRPPGEARAAIAMPKAGAAPRWDDALIAKEDLARLRARYERMEPIACDAEVAVEFKGEAPRPCKLRLLLERDEELRRGEGVFVRQGITVENPSASRPRGARWILSVGDRTLSEFLGDAENPAHTEWQRSTPLLKRKYVRAASTLDYIRALPRNLVSLLTRPEGGREKNLLAHVFALGRETAPLVRRRKAGAQGGAEETETGEPPSGPGTYAGRAIEIVRIRNGFRIAGGALEDGAPPRALRIELAYDVRSGDPFRRYVPFDFDVGRPPIRLDAKGAVVLTKEKNRIELRPGAGKFSLVARGFDTHRDLRIRVVELEES